MINLKWNIILKGSPFTLGSVGASSDPGLGSPDSSAFSTASSLVEISGGIREEGTLVEDTFLLLEPLRLSSCACFSSV